MHIRARLLRDGVMEAVTVRTEAANLDASLRLGYGRLLQVAVASGSMRSADY